MAFPSIRYKQHDGALVDSLSDIMPFEKDVHFPEQSDQARLVDADTMLHVESGIVGCYSDTYIEPSDDCGLVATRSLTDAIRLKDGSVFRKYTTLFQTTQSLSLGPFTSAKRFLEAPPECSGVVNQSLFTEVRAYIPMIAFERDAQEIVFEVGQTVSSNMGPVIIHHIEFNGSVLSWGALEDDFAEGLSSKDVYIWADTINTPVNKRTGTLRFLPDYLALSGDLAPDPCPACQE
jgi:hypothetical protein